LLSLGCILQAGKGRTGLMVCTYLVYIGLSAEEALQLYAQKRTTNNEGVSPKFCKKTHVIYARSDEVAHSRMTQGSSMFAQKKSCKICKKMQQERIQCPCAMRSVYIMVSSDCAMLIHENNKEILQVKWSLLLFYLSYHFWATCTKYKERHIIIT